MLLVVGWSSRLPLHMQLLLLSLCSRASLGAPRLQDHHLSMLPCSQRICDTIRNRRYRIFPCHTLSALKAIGQRASVFSMSFHLKRSFIWWNFGIYFDSVTSVLLVGEQKQCRKSTYPKISAAVAVCGRKHITSKVLLSFVLNASFIFFKLIYNIIDFGAIVKGEKYKYFW